MQSVNRCTIHSPRRTVAAAILVLATAQVPATAAETGYAGLRAGAGAGTRDTAGDGGHLELFAGYRISPRFALELAFSERRARDAQRFDSFDAQSIEVVSKGTVRGVQLLARIDLPLAERWSAHARGGIAHFDTTLRTVVPDLGQPEFEVGRAALGFVAAVGVDYHLDAAWRLGLDYQRAAGDFRLNCDGPSCRFDRSGQLAAATATLTYAF